MKKWINRIMTVLFVLFTAILGSTALTSCDRESGNRKIKNSDSAFVVRIVDKYCHPEMSTVDEAIMLQRQMLMEDDYNYVFRNMPTQTLKAVVHVMMHKNHGTPTFTVKDIAQEYLSSQRVYDNLPDENKQDPDMVANPKVLNEPDSVEGGK